MPADYTKLTRAEKIRFSARERAEDQQDAHVTRWVVTHINRAGCRVLSSSAQGRYTFATRDEAVEHCTAMQANNSRRRLAEVFGRQALGTFDVRACDCWPGHFDPKGVYFDT